MGRVDETGTFLAALQSACASGRPWFARVARVVPVETTFTFSPDTLGEQFKRAAAPFVARMQSGSFYVRLERRGFEGKIPSQAIEREVAEHLFAIAAQQGKALRTHFDDPDYLVVAETLGEECGVALLTRELRRCYPFVEQR